MKRITLGVALVALGASAVSAQQFGAYSAVHGGQLFISEPVNQSAPTTIYLFRQSGSGWTQSGTMMAPEHEGSDYFGRFVAVDERSLVIGGTTLDNSTGGVWLYRPGDDGWEFDEMLRPEDVAEGDSFGRFGLLHGDLLFVSALGHNESRGAVWVFQRDGNGDFVREAKLEPGENAPASEFFGWSLAFDGEHLITGALQASQDLQNRGAAYIFQRNAPGDWSLMARLALDEEEARPGDGFGSAVGWFNGAALVGMPGRGEVHAFLQHGDEWTLGSVLTPYDGGSGFGSAIAASGNELWIGANNANQEGRVYRYQWDPAAEEFASVSKIIPEAGDVGDGFGSTITLTEQLAVVGATGDDFGLGSAVVFERSGDGWTMSQRLYGPDPAGLTALTGNEINCDSGKADRYGCNNVDIVSFLPVRDIGGGRGARTNDVWGWTDPETNHEIAIVGRTDGTAFIDVTNAANPVYLGNLPKTPGSQGNAWRDIKVYQNHAYVVADGAGQHGMQVFDLTRLRNVSNPPETFTEDAHYPGIGSAHNIVINEESGYAYAVGVNSGGETCGGGLHMIDIRTPDQPTFIGCFADTTTGNAGTGYSHDAMCIEYDGPDRDYAGKEICFGSNETALSIADVSDKAHPVQISSATYPNVGYAHQGWITEDHKYFYMNDEGDETNAQQAGEPLPGTRTLIWDVQDLDDPIMIKEHFGETFTIDHNLYIKDDLMYQSNYVSGLRILDISDPENPEEVGFLDTVPESEEVVFDGSWSNYPYFASGTIVVSSGAEGVFFLRYRPQDLVP